ncbi:ABC transporter substrate-binding protein [Clostridium lacusfryxellense]|uniref:ABC transporter substrate-binding protein n=1 Tax=Clostridium lacusfryxellense TaxID=205328 RepID=UPI001C0AEEBD|nr:ABC transporter substrate-binding protein [Clostridium lacusfryxellense]MBU3112210.1 ABC transporter substrate-binding protein [Clostridium lacusfryxellense]
MKRALSIFVVITIFISVFTSYNLLKGKESKDDNEKATNNKPITLTMYSQDPNGDEDGFQNPVAKEITKATGVTLKIRYPVGNVAEDISLMIASKEYPDLVFSKGEQLNQLVSASSLIDLTPLIDKFGPNIKKLYGNYMNRNKYSINDKSIYTLGSSAVTSGKLEPVMGFELQHAVVKELGYPKIETVKDFENAIFTYKQKHPTINGKKTIGLSLIASEWRWNIGIGNGAGFATGAPDDGNWYIDPVTFDAVYRFTRSSEKEYYRWLNHMNSINLIDPDSFVQKYDQYLAKIADGNVLGLIDAKWDYSGGENKLNVDKSYERTYGMYPVQLDKSTTSADFREYGYSGGWGFGITANSEHKEDAMKFIDWMSSDTAQILNNWGIEGINYKTINGKREITDEEWEKRNNDENYPRETGVGVYSYPFPSRGIGKKDSSGQFYIPSNAQNIMKNYNPVEKEVLSAYGKAMWRDFYPASKDLPASSWGMGFMINIPSDSDIALIMQKCTYVMEKGTIKAIMAKPSEFDGIWDNLMKELEENEVDKMNKHFTKLVKERVEMWK